MAQREDEQPLLNEDGEIGQPQSPVNDDVVGDLTKVPAGQEAGVSSAPGLFVWLLTLSAGLSGLLFGCAFV